MNQLELLTSQLEICQIHAKRLNLAISKIESLYPFSSERILALNEEILAYMELFTSRLGKLQDTLGDKVFTSLLTILGEETNNKSYIDKLNKLEKLGILSSTLWWQDLRNLRNFLTHEYPDNPAFIADNLNTAYVQAKRLLLFMDSLNDYIKTNVTLNH